MSKIIDIIGREILDSRGNPTVEVDVITEIGNIGRASVPSGASTGSLEALELRDGENRYNGKGVMNAVANVNGVLKDNIVGMDSIEQEKIDRLMLELDGTNNCSNLGANAILGISLAVLKAGALDKDLPLYKYLGDGRTFPRCMMNVINGGAHADNNVDFQEFMIIPNRKDFSNALRVGVEVFNSLKKVLLNNNYGTSVGDEGGFAPNLKSNMEAFDLLIEAIENAGYTLGEDVNIAIDVAASEFYNKEINMYEINEGKDKLTSDQLIDWYVELCNKYPIISIEDGLDEKDYDGWARLTEELGDRIQIVGDDVFATNKEMLQMGIEKNIANAILLKVNQIGTVTETLKTIKLAKKHNYATIISHRSGETEDTYISHFAVGLNLGQIKTGSLSRSERVAKYNELLRIEEVIFNDISDKI